MKFGPLPVEQALGAILAHSLALPGGRLRKGHVLGAGDLTRLANAGHAQVVVARLEPEDIGEDAAALALARALAPDLQRAGLRRTAPFTGRVNLVADGAGVAVLDAQAIAAANAVHPMITIATVPPCQQMHPGGMLATIKIISYAVPRDALEQACAAAQGALRLARPVLRRAALVVTTIAGGPDDTKGIAATRARLAALDIDLVEAQRLPHDQMVLAQALPRLQADLVLILTASATSDPDDVAPAALRAAGGTVERFGMPVDPGNLLFLGRLGDCPVIGLPGCARSPALNGADWVLSRLACGIPVSSAEIAAMGVGGLLKEIPTRPHPRGRTPAG